MTGLRIFYKTCLLCPFVLISQCCCWRKRRQRERLLSWSSPSGDFEANYKGDSTAFLEIWAIWNPQCDWLLNKTQLLIMKAGHAKCPPISIICVFGMTSSLSSFGLRHFALVKHYWLNHDYSFDEGYWSDCWSSRQIHKETIECKTNVWQFPLGQMRVYLTCLGITRSLDIKPPIASSGKWCKLFLTAIQRHFSWTTKIIET